MCPGVSDVLALSAPSQAYRVEAAHPMLRVLKITRQGTPMRAYFRPPDSYSARAEWALSPAGIVEDKSPCAEGAKK